MKNYIIGTGWWCGKGEPNPKRKILGSEVIRGKEFHKLWYESVCRFSDPSKIVIVDSASPVKPDLNKKDDRIEFISLIFNAGHPTVHRGMYSGWSRSVLLGIEYALMCDVDYFVYVEQDVLLYGKEIVEMCIDKMRGLYMFGSGDGTPQALQQSFFMIRKDGMKKFLNNIQFINHPDSALSPEAKFAVATNPALGVLPPRLLQTRYGRKLCSRLGQFERLPIGYGRKRPINFSDSHFYFQHGSEEEIDQYIKLTGIKVNYK